MVLADVTLGDVRDVFIILLALESLIVVGLLVWLILELRGLTNLLKKEIRPILTSAQETVSTVRGTTAFVTSNVVAPFIKVQGAVAGFRAIVDTLTGHDKKR
jgi:hypothetical protein